MASLRFTLSLLFILAAVIQAQALQCYVCNDCESGYENSVATCQPDTGGSTTPSTSAGTESSSASTSTSTESTSPSTSTSTESTSPSTSSSTESTSPSTSTSTESTSPSTSSSTESTSPSTSSSTESTSPSTSPSSDNESIDVQRRFRRYVKQFRANSTQARCVVTSYEENGQTKTNRGCSIGENVSDDARCKSVAGNHNGTLSRCYVCEEDKCNSATKSAIAFVPFLIGMIINYLLN